MRRLFYGIALGWLALLASARAGTITSLGVLYVGEESRLELPFHNESPNTVSVDGAEASCECLVPQFVRTEIPAGETRHLTFNYRPTAIGRIRVDIDYLVDSASAVRRSVVGVVADRQRLLTIEQLRDFQSTIDIVLIDLRRPDRFAAVRLPGSLNVPAFALRHRTDLKTRKVVLIDEGFSPAALTEQAEILQQNGFAEVYIVEGGVASWIRAGGAVEGLTNSAQAAARITPTEFLRFQATDHWHVVNAVSGDSPTLPKSESGDPRGRVAPRVLVMASDDSGYSAMERHSADGDLRVFYLDGGEKALAAYQIEQTRMTTSSGAVFQSKSTQPHVVATSGCGTCPK